MPQPKDVDWLIGYKNKTHIYAVFKRPTLLLGTHKNWKWEDGRKHFMQTGVKRKLEKMDFKMNSLRDKGGHYLMIKWSIQEDITILNIYAPNIGSPQCIRQLLTTLKGQTDNNIIIVGDFNTLLTTMDRSSR